MLHLWYIGSGRSMFPVHRKLLLKQEIACSVVLCTIIQQGPTDIWVYMGAADADLLVRF